MIIDGTILFVGFAMGVFFGFLTGLIKFIIVNVIRWMTK